YELDVVHLSDLVARVSGTGTGFLAGGDGYIRDVSVQRHGVHRQRGGLGGRPRDSAWREHHRGAQTLADRRLRGSGAVSAPAHASYLSLVHRVVHHVGARLSLLLCQRDGHQPSGHRAEIRRRADWPDQHRSHGPRHLGPDDYGFHRQVYWRLEHGLLPRRRHPAGGHGGLEPLCYGEKALRLKVMAERSAGARVREKMLSTECRNYPVGFS